ncbi:phage regulatory CII family protein [Pseudomonas sp. JS3066]|uniref:phage regulatory CII family protein n=1 Tax=Pseudomonas sp. JS3066 TaxID=3090665 RepID=UPI002E7BA5B5|nr:phage regulatory CII family protein [Pseudomonas sp. JS3066]WVK93822.1 phage regulatory CII family protein [Pseudomonas sp. JS3066]
MSRARFGYAERARRTILTLPQALHHAARDYPGGATAIAAIDGDISPSTFNHKLSLTNTTHTPNIRDLELILDATRDPRIVESILRPIGWVGIDVSDLRETDTPKALLAGISEMLSREGDLTQHLSKSLDDDDLNDDELAEFEALTERLVQAVFKLGAAVRKKHAEDCAHG